MHTRTSLKLFVGGAIVGLTVAWACVPGGPGDLLPDANAQGTGACAQWDFSWWERSTTATADDIAADLAANTRRAPAGWEPTGVGSGNSAGLLMFRRCAD